MTISITSDPLPLKLDDFGVIRVGSTRVTLDAIVTAYLEGSTAEEIAEQYPVVALADIYAAIGFLLRRREDVEVYLRERQREHDAIRRENEARCPPGGIRERLLSRRSAKQR